jgi:oligopeptide/dipeptide ABC transporter ATP-binding protein
MADAELRQIRGGVVAYIFQDPSTSLNPVMRVEAQIKETLARHQPGLAHREEIIRLLRLVGIPDADQRCRDYPFQLSGGMQQRVMIAMALASRPRLLVADEPTTALDVTIQAQILELLNQLKQELGMAILLITHNLGLVHEVADKAAVMYAGQIVEVAPARELLVHPCHPYTQALLHSLPKPGLTKSRLKAIPGQVPQLHAMPGGCRFHPRCALVQISCSQQAPQLVQIDPNRWTRCPFVRDVS